jgi:hypothetical protein
MGESITTRLSPFGCSPELILSSSPVDNRAVPEVAELMGTPVPTAYTRLRSARLTFADVVSFHAEALK